MVEKLGQSGAEGVDRPLRGEIDQIGLAIKARRSERGWSLRKLATEAGVSASLLSAVETGKIVPTVASLFAVSDALGLPAESLFPVERRPVSSGDAPPPLQDDSAEHAATPLPERLKSETDAGLVPEVAATARSRDDPGGAAAGRSGSKGMPEAAPTAGLDRRHDESHRGGRSVPRSRRLAKLAVARVNPSGSRGTSTPQASGSVAMAPPPGDAASGSAPVPNAAITGTAPRLAVVRVDDRPRMVMDDGTSWSQVPMATSSSLTMIEVSIPGDRAWPPRYRTHAYPVQILVLSGLLIVEGAFTRRELVEGDMVTVDELVPHRLGTSGTAACRFLWTVTGPWDGRI